MQTTDLKVVWKDLASLIDALPEDEKARYLGAIRILIHDLRQNIAITQSAEALLRRSIPATPDNLELLDSIRVADRRAIELVSDLAQPFDSEITLALNSSSPDK